MSTSRREFLRTTGFVAALATTGLPRRLAAEERQASWGPLIDPPDGDKDLLALPAGFTCTLLQTAGEPMSDGYRVPGRADGMAAFEDDGGRWVLLRNHELSGSGDEGPWGPDEEAPPEAYDPAEQGSVTRVVLDPDTLEVLSSNLVLTGTTRNCAGGPSPWGWLSCEESVITGHGYVFACPVEADTVQPLQPIVGYGRCRHEAVAIDPETHIAYLTEDRGDAALYRFVPDDPADPHGPGRLQAMVVDGRDGFDTATDMDTGDVLPVTWVDLDEPEPEGDTLRFEAHDKGAAYISRGEGIWHHGDAVWICATDGGPAFGGQIFRLSLTGGTLELVAQSTSRLELDMPDNVAVAPWGQLFMAEDGVLSAHIRAITRDGRVVPFANNVHSTSELAGVCFSPDGSTLFVNMQEQGHTLAVRGPWPTWPEGATSADGTPAPDPADPSPPDEPTLDDPAGGCQTTPRTLGWAALALAALGLRANGRDPVDPSDAEPS